MTRVLVPVVVMLGALVNPAAQSRVSAEIDRSHSVGQVRDEARVWRSTSAAAQPTLQDFDVNAPGLGRLQGTVARPPGLGPFPTVLLLHGTHGYAREYVGLAADLAGEGILGVAACWFEGRRGEGVRFVTPLACDGGPPLTRGDDEKAIQAVDRLLAILRERADVRRDAVFLFGHSRGAAAVLNYAVAHPSAIPGIVLNSSPYPPEFIAAGSRLRVPILLLHGTADGPAEGGSLMTTIQHARAFESALIAAGVSVEAAWYEGAGHSGLFTDPEQRADSMRRVADFVRRAPPRGPQEVPVNAGTP